MEGEQIVEVVAIVVGAVVTLGSLWLQLRMRRLEKQVDQLRATVASVHAVLVNPPQ